jgi:hypothetical protein
MKDALREAFIEAAAELQERAYEHYAKGRVMCGLRGAGAAKDAHRWRSARWHQRRGANLSEGARLLVRQLIDRRRVARE